ncbi:MAG TPA: D-alanyl-D-alanine carboxypeptidase/D-alanyl-D-alanine-endopeptidase [Sphingobacteriaceae bacterium]
MNIRLIFILLLSAVPGFAQNLSQQIAKAYSAFETDPQLKYGVSSLTVLNAKTGEVLFSKNEDVGLASASTLKTVTAATAYYLLGSDFTWQTTMGYTGRIENGTLNGDIIIKGGGDPTLGSWRYPGTKNEVVFNKWVEAIRQAGICKVNGKIIADDALFGSQTLPTGWSWQDMGNYYGAGPNSLTWHENQFDLYFVPGSKVGDDATLVRTEPALAYLKIVNEVKTGRPGSGDNVYVYSAPYSEVIYLRGTYGIDLKKVIGGSVPDPAFELAANLQDTLGKLNITVANAPSTARQLAFEKRNVPVIEKVLNVHTSPALSEVNYWFNQKSINLYGEHLLKTLAWKHGKQPATPEGVRVLQHFWKEKLGLDPDAINIMDGSGLSAGNRITTSAMARILQSIKAEPWFASFYEGLPVYNNMKMKSGTINDVLGYTGYHTSSAGEPVVFSFLVNNYNGSASAVRQKMFKVLDTLK